MVLVRLRWVLLDSGWFSLVSDGSIRFLMAFVGFEWFYWISVDFRWFCMVLADFYWFSLVLGASTPFLIGFHRF